MIKVVSWNIEHGKNVDQAASEIQAIEPLNEPDILLVQEMAPEQTERLGELLDMDHRYFAVAEHCETGRPFGNAVLSKWPLGDSTGMALPHTAIVQGQARSFTIVPVQVAGLAILACSVHIETVLLSLRKRRRQVEQLTEYLASTSGPLVVGGDFNTASMRSQKSFRSIKRAAGFDQASLTDAPTFDRFGRSFALDHLFVRDLVADRAGVSREATASDHHPIWATVDHT